MPPIPSQPKHQKIPPWQKKTLTEDDKQVVRNAVAIYCYENDYEAKDLTASRDEVIEILPTVAKQLKQWESINSDNFALSVPAHRSLFDTIRNLIVSQKTMQTLINEVANQPSQENENDYEEEYSDQVQMMSKK